MAPSIERSRSPMPNHKPANERGVALIASLTVLAIAVVTATAMAYQVHVNMRRTQNVVTNERAWQYAMSAEKAALALLARDRANNEIDYRNPARDAEPWYTEQPISRALPGGGELTFALADLQARLNLNTVARTTKSDASDNNDDDSEGNNSDPEQARAQLKRLFSRGEVPTDGKPITAAIADWIDEDRKVRFPGGAEDDYYTQRDIPHRAANTPMVSSTEIKRLKGLEGDTVAPFWNRLCQYVVALPSDASAINVNTASVPLLTSLADPISPEIAERAVSQRRETPYESVDDFLSRNREFNIPELNQKRLTVASEYFRLHTRIRQGGTVFHLYSTIYRPSKGNEEDGLRVIHRTRIPPRPIGSGNQGEQDENERANCIGARLAFQQQ